VEIKRREKYPAQEEGGAKSNTHFLKGVKKGEWMAQKIGNKAGIVWKKTRGKLTTPIKGGKTPVFLSKENPRDKSP